MDDHNPLSPCPHAPRSAGKIACMAERARLGLPLFHADDNATDADPSDLTPLVSTPVYRIAVGA